MDSFGFTPNEIADMTPEQQFLCFRQVKMGDGNEYALYTGMNKIKKLMSSMTMGKGL